jgi:hypothetical protein
MIRILRSLSLACALSFAFLAGRGALAAETTAAVWYDDCRSYIGILRGTGDGDDLEVTYCMGQTLGIIEGLRTGSRIGALSMASIMSVLLGLDSEQVFEVFKEASTEDLLGYCAPPDQPGSGYILIVADHLDRNPATLEVSATAAFFEALREAYPCAAADAPAAQGGPEASPPPPATDE